MKTSVLLEAERESRILIDLRNPNNIFAFLLLRRVLRQVGKAYARRCETYTLFFMLVGFGAVLTIVAESGNARAERSCVR